MSDFQDLMVLLRAFANAEHDDVSVCDDAADAIAELRAENELLRKALAGDDSDLKRLLDKYASDCQEFFEQAEAHRAENERLRAEARAPWRRGVGQDSD